MGSFTQKVLNSGARQACKPDPFLVAVSRCHPAEPSYPPRVYRCACYVRCVVCPGPRGRFLWLQVFSVTCRTSTASRVVIVWRVAEASAPMQSPPCAFRAYPFQYERCVLAGGTPLASRSCCGSRLTGTLLRRKCPLPPLVLCTVYAELYYCNNCYS